MKVIRIENLKKNYGIKNVLSDINLEVEHGEFVVIIGKSGSGKSTLINIIGLLDNDFAGAYYLNDLNVKSCNCNQLCKIRNCEIGFVFQMYNLIGDYTVRENILLPTIYSKKTFVEYEYYRSILETLHIAHLEKELVNNLSGGEKQRVAIARASINKPKLIIADEPTGNLDPENTNNVLEMFKYLKGQGVTILMVTHDDSVLCKADRVLKLENGRLIC